MIHIRTKCAYCKGEIDSNIYKQVDDKFYHINCFNIYDKEPTFNWVPLNRRRENEFIMYIGEEGFKLYKEAYEKAILWGIK
jgi:hypothetical protein